MTTEFQKLQVGDIFCVTTTEQEGEEIRQHSRTYCVQTILPNGCVAICYDHTANAYTVEVLNSSDFEDVELCPEDGKLFADLIIVDGKIVKIAFE